NIGSTNNVRVINQGTGAYTVIFRGAAANSNAPLLTSTNTLNTAGPTVAITIDNLLQGGFGDETQQITTFNTTGTSTATFGNFVIAFNGQSTGNIAFNATSGDVQTALASLATVGSGNVEVSGSASRGYFVHFMGNLANRDVPSLSVVN